MTAPRTDIANPKYGLALTALGLHAAPLRGSIRLAVTPSPCFDTKFHHSDR